MQVSFTMIGNIFITIVQHLVRHIKNGEILKKENFLIIYHAPKKKVKCLQIHGHIIISEIDLIVLQKNLPITTIYGNMNRDVNLVIVNIKMLLINILKIMMKALFMITIIVILVL